MIHPTHVDLAFPARGIKLARDHGHALYAALSRAMPELHGAGWVGVHNVPGKLAGSDTLDISTGSYVRLRIPAERIAQLLLLAGQTLEVLGSTITLGAPVVHALRPVAALDAQLVVIRLTNGVGHPFDRAAFDERFAGEARRQLERIGVVGELALRGRRRMTVGGRQVIGHAVGVTGLSAEHSVLLQVHGIGGKRTMGCGLFRPARVRMALASEVRSAS